MAQRHAGHRRKVRDECAPYGVVRRCHRVTVSCILGDDALFAGPGVGWAICAAAWRGETPPYRVWLVWWRDGTGGHDARFAGLGVGCAFMAHRHVGHRRKVRDECAPYGDPASFFATISFTALGFALPPVAFIT